MRESIKSPNKVVVERYQKPSVMPAFDNILSEEEIGYLIEFIKSHEEDPNANKPDGGA